MESSILFIFEGVVHRSRVVCVDRKVLWDWVFFSGVLGEVPSTVNALGVLVVADESLSPAVDIDVSSSNSPASFCCNQISDSPLLECPDRLPALSARCVGLHVVAHPSLLSPESEENSSSRSSEPLESLPEPLMVASRPSLRFGVRMPFFLVGNAFSTFSTLVVVTAPHCQFVRRIARFFYLIGYGRAA